MAGSLKFDGLVDYSTKDPALLRVELQRQNAKVRDAFARAELLLEPLPAERVAIGTVKATFGEALLCDTTNGDVIIEAPEITSADRGKFVDLVHIRTGNTVVFRPFGSQKVQNTIQASLTLMGVLRIRAFAGAWWVHL